MEKISFQVDLDCSYEEARALVEKALKAEGFGVLTEIDVKATIKKKLDADFRKYAILGACNPPLAHKALQSEPLVGLLLPCNVTVEETEHGATIHLLDPNAMLLINPILAENAVIKEVAQEAYTRLSRVADSLANPS